MYYSLQGNLTTICILSFLQEIGLTIPFKKPSINSRLTENVLFYGKKLLQNILIPESQIKLSSQVLSAFVRKFTKKRCVTYLARDGLAPKHEEDASAVRQMLQKVNHKAYSNTTSKAQSGYICFRCEKQGHWANECPEGHELEWLANQNCFLCGKKGHLKEACPNKISKDDHFKTKLEENKPPAVKPSWYQNSTSLIKLLGNLSVKSTSDFKCYKSLSSKTSVHSDPKFYKQKTAELFNVRKGENQ